MKYGLIYDFRENYFYAYRSGIVVGKYRFSEIADNRYQCTEIATLKQHLNDEGKKRVFAVSLEDLHRL